MYIYIGRSCSCGCFDLLGLMCLTYGVFLVRKAVLLVRKNFQGKADFTYTLCLIFLNASLCWRQRNNSDISLDARMPLYFNHFGKS